MGFWNGVSPEFGGCLGSFPMVFGGCLVGLDWVAPELGTAGDLRKIEIEIVKGKRKGVWCCLAPVHWSFELLAGARRGQRDRGFGLETRVVWWRLFFVSRCKRRNF